MGLGKLRVPWKFWILLPSLVGLFILYFNFRHTYQQKTQALFESSPLASGTDTYHFVPTAAEDQCQRGQNPLLNGKRPVPNLVHYVVGIKNPEISFASYLAIQSALRSIRPKRLKLHHTGNLNRNNVYIKTLLRDKHVKIVSHDSAALERETRVSKRFGHLPEVLRLQVLQKEGGIYLDDDVFVMQSFASLRNSTRDVVLGHQGGNRQSISNAVIVARPGARFLEHWINSYRLSRSLDWNWHSSVLPKKLVDEYPGEACSLSPHAFFWPTWTKSKVRWMHQPLSRTEARDVKIRLSANNGSLFWGQLAYHGWNYMSKEQYLSNLNEEKVLKEDTRFNIMTRRFLLS
jgi:hypothetical protein